VNTAQRRSERGEVVIVERDVQVYVLKRAQCCLVRFRRDDACRGVLQQGDEQLESQGEQPVEGRGGQLLEEQDEQRGRLGEQQGGHRMGARGVSREEKAGSEWWDE